MPKRKLYAVSRPKDGGWDAREFDAGLIASGDRKPGGLYVPTGVLSRGPHQVVRVVRSDRFGDASVARG